jgi:hypothetical protein
MVGREGRRFTVRVQGLPAQVRYDPRRVTLRTRGRSIAGLPSLAWIDAPDIRIRAE